jgi:hypothetical protein
MSSNLDDFGGNVSPVSNDNSADSKLTEFILRKAQELKIRKFGQDLAVVPTEQNGHTVVTSTTVVLDDQREFKKVNCIYGKKHGIQDVERLVSESLARATYLAIDLVQDLSSTPQVIESAPVANNEFFPAGAPQQKQFKHRHDKDISPKQLETIRKMAYQRRLNPEVFVKNNMGQRELARLNSAQANEVIQALMKVKVVSTQLDLSR